MTKPVGVEGYSSNNVYNESAIMNDSIELGSDHPYEGIAGLAKFTTDVSSEFIGEGARTRNDTNDPLITDGNVMRYSLKVIDEPEFFPGSSSTPSVMKIKIYPIICPHNGRCRILQ